MDRPIQSFTYIYTQVYTIYLYVELVPRKKEREMTYKTGKMVAALHFSSSSSSCLHRGEEFNWARRGRWCNERLQDGQAHSIDSTRHLSIELIWCNSLSLSLFLFFFYHLSTHTHTYIYIHALPLSLSPGCTLSDKHGQEDSERDTLPTKKREMELDWIFMSPSLPVLLQRALHTKKEKKKGEQNRLAFLLRERERINRRRGRIILSKRYIYCRISRLLDNMRTFHFL